MELKTKLDIAKERKISELEDTKKLPKRKHREIAELWDNIKLSNILLIGI